MTRNQNQNFSYNNFGLGEELGTTETFDQAERVQRLRPQMEAKNLQESERRLEEEDPETLLERCKNNRLLSPDYSIFDDGDEWYGKKRCDNVVFAHDHLRTWETTNAVKGPLSPQQDTVNSHTTPKVNRRYMGGGRNEHGGFFSQDSTTRQENGPRMES